MPDYLITVPLQFLHNHQSQFFSPVLVSAAVHRPPVHKSIHDGQRRRLDFAFAR